MQFDIKSNYRYNQSKHNFYRHSFIVCLLIEYENKLYSISKSIVLWVLIFLKHEYKLSYSNIKIKLCQ